MEHKQGRIAPGYETFKGEVGFFTDDHDRILAELISEGLVDPASFCLDELKARLAGMRTFQDIETKIIQVWFPDVRRRIQKLATVEAADSGTAEHNM